MSDCYCGDRSQLDLFHSPEGCVSRSSTAVSQPWIERSQLPLCARCGHQATWHEDSASCCFSGCLCGGYTANLSPAVDKPVDEGVTLQPALDEAIRKQVHDRVTRDPHYFGTRLPTPAEVEAEAQRQLRRRGFPAPDPVVVELEQRLAAMTARIEALEQRLEFHGLH